MPDADLVRAQDPGGAGVSSGSTEAEADGDAEEAAAIGGGRAAREGQPRGDRGVLPELRPEADRRRRVSRRGGEEDVSV